MVGYFFTAWYTETDTQATRDNTMWGMLDN